MRILTAFIQSEISHFSKEYLENKIKMTLEKYHLRDNTVAVTVKKDSGNHDVSIHLLKQKHEAVIASSQGRNVDTVISEAVDKFNSQIRKIHSKQRRRHSA